MLVSARDTGLFRDLAVCRPIHGIYAATGIEMASKFESLHERGKCRADTQRHTPTEGLRLTTPPEYPGRIHPNIHFRLDRSFHEWRTTEYFAGDLIRTDCHGAGCDIFPRRL